MTPRTKFEDRRCIFLLIRRHVLSRCGTKPMFATRNQTSALEIRLYQTNVSRLAPKLKRPQRNVFCCLPVNRGFILQHIQAFWAHWSQPSPCGLAVPNRPRKCYHTHNGAPVCPALVLSNSGPALVHIHVDGPWRYGTSKSTRTCQSTCSCTSTWFFIFWYHLIFLFKKSIILSSRLLRLGLRG